MPDGRTVAYVSNQGDGPAAIWAQPYDRTGTDQLLFQAEWEILGFDVAPIEGLPIILNARDGLWLAEPAGGSARPFLATDFSERRPRISPDGRWVAYVSDESGGEEVYVRSFPGGGRPWAISRGSGNLPVWSRSGEEIIYAASGQGLMAATVGLGAEVRVSGTRVVLSDVIGFEMSMASRPSASYDVSPDGERLLLIAGSGTGVTLGTAEANVVVLNVFEELRQRTAVN
jgi:hypothetical protein